MELFDFRAFSRFDVPFAPPNLLILLLNAGFESHSLRQLLHIAAKNQGLRGLLTIAPVTVAMARQESVPIEINAIGHAQPYRTVQINRLLQVSAATLSSGLRSN